jgi:SSS family solute:Na+ symporter
VGSNAVFLAAIIGELIVISFFFLDKYNILGLAFLWLNVVGAVAVVLLGLLFQWFMDKFKN